MDQPKGIKSLTGGPIGKKDSAKEMRQIFEV
jgi:hypothetical protein